MTQPRWRWRRLSGALALAALLPTQGGVAGAAKAARPTVLHGTFTLTPGGCVGFAVHGSYLRLAFPGTSATSGRFFYNPDSACTNQSYTLVTPGLDGGLVTGHYQPDPAPAFTSAGSALARAIIQPTGLTGVEFSVATDRIDPQSGRRVPAPRLVARAGKVTGQLEAWSWDWQGRSFNQGSPKPAGARQGVAAAVAGTYDPTTGAFVLTWASPIVAGPFNGFTGVWYLTGRFVPSK